MQKLAALILAAGVAPCSEQWGPMLPVGNDTMIRRTISVMHKAGADPIVVATGYKNNQLKLHLHDLPVEFLYNRKYASTQMYDSLLMGLRHLDGRCDRLLLIPADVPTLEEASIRRLLTEKAQIVRPVYEGRTGHPIVIDSSVFASLLSYNGQNGLHGAFQLLHLQIKNVSVADVSTVFGDSSPETRSRLLKYNLAVGGGREMFHVDISMNFGAVGKAFSPEIAQFLEMIDLTGSMQQACSVLKISYSKGWKMIREIEDAWGIQLVERKVGGRKGGGTRLAPDGEKLLKAQKEWEHEVMCYAEESFQRCFDPMLFIQPDV